MFSHSWDILQKQDCTGTEDAVPWQFKQSETGLLLLHQSRACTAHPTCSETVWGTKTANVFWRKKKRKGINKKEQSAPGLIPQTDPSRRWAALQCQHRRGWTVCWGKAQQHCSLTDTEETLLWKCIWRERCVFRRAFVKTPLRKFFFPLQKASCSSVNSDDDFCDIIQNFSVYVGQTIQYQKHKAEEISNNLDYKSCWHQTAAPDGTALPAWIIAAFLTCGSSIHWKVLMDCKFSYVGMLTRIWICLFQPG